jgi:hypothetical protein
MANIWSGQLSLRIASATSNLTSRELVNTVSTHAPHLNQVISMKITDHFRLSFRFSETPALTGKNGQHPRVSCTATPWPPVRAHGGQANRQSGTSDL